MQTGVDGVQLFRVTEPIRCAPAVYEPSLVAIVSGAKEAILDGERNLYGSSQYMCCSLSLPVEAGTPEASPENPLLGVYIALNTRMMTQLALEMENVAAAARAPVGEAFPPAVALAGWDDAFTDALLRLLQICSSATDTAILGEGRLRELYYAVLKGEAGDSARRAFGVGNEMARAIEYISSRLDETISIEDIVSRLGMSRAVFHRRFKQATRMSPIQFVKAMRLNRAAVKMVDGMTVSEAALSVGYESSSQFSREFKRLYGQSPRQWSQSKRQAARVV